MGGFQNNFQSYTRLSEGRNSTLQRGLQKGFLRISDCFRRSNKKLYIWFSEQQGIQKIWKPSSYIKKSLIKSCKSSKKYSSRNTVSFIPPPLPCVKVQYIQTVAGRCCGVLSSFGEHIFCIWPDSVLTKLLDHPKQKSRRKGLWQINTCQKVPLHFAGKLF